MNRSELLGFTLIVAFPVIVCGVCWLHDRTDVPVRSVRLGGVYRVAHRKVLVMGVSPGVHVVTLVLLDVRTGERAAVTYHDGATFGRVMRRSIGRLR